MLCLHVANDRAQKEPSCLCQASPVIRMFVYPFMKASPCDLNTFCKALSANTVELEVCSSWTWGDSNRTKHCFEPGLVTTISLGLYNIKINLYMEILIISKVLNERCAGTLTW